MQDNFAAGFSPDDFSYQPPGGNDMDAFYEIMGHNEPGPPPAPPPPMPQPKADDPDKQGILALGHNKGVFYYLSIGARQVYELTAAQHTKNSLMAMASSVYYWERTEYCIDGKIKWDLAIDALMNDCRRMGIYQPDRLRGRGAWLDKGRMVVHLGDRLIVDGKEQELILPESRHIYEAAQPIADEIYSDPLTNQRAFQLVEICRHLRFERSIDGLLLAGFIAIAPICGALAWRPSIWITGGTGTGKSWIQEKIITKALGKIALSVTSKTSEAGIRQELQSDARPVIFDEAEGEDAYAASRMQGVLDLVRQSASEGGAEIIKGSQNQSGAKRYRIRSCFLFSSINVGLEHSADENRVTVLALRVPEQSDAEKRNFAHLKDLVERTITGDFAAGMLARSAKSIHTIRHNAEIFADAAAEKFGNRRLGDQIGALLAGAHSLHTPKQISAADAREWLDKNADDIHAPETNDKDEYRLLTAITQRRIRISTGNGGAHELTIARLLTAAWGKDEQIAYDVAERELKQFGIKTEIDGAIISTNHPALKNALQGTPWVKQWSKTLLRLPGAKDMRTQRFLGHVGNGTFVPIVLITGEEKLTFSS
jgi:putative DNA primase/helicase